MQATLPRISYQATVADTNETTTRVVENVEVMFAEVLLNKDLAELAYNDALDMDVKIDPVTDTLTMVMKWISTGKKYITIVADKLPAALN